MKDINLFKTKNSLFFKKIKTKEEASADCDCDGFLIDASEEEARRIIQSLKGARKQIAIVGEDDQFNRRAIETLKINYLVSPEIGDARDTLKQRDSGLNHVVAKEAKNNNIVLVINMSEISKLDDKSMSKMLGRIIQNIKICRKAKCDIKIASLATSKKEIVDEKGRKSFGISLGMSSAQSLMATKF